MGTTQEIVAHLESLERALLTPEVRQSAPRLRELLDPDFLEIGSSGRMFDREGIIEALRTEPDRERSFSDFRVIMLSPAIALATYTTSRTEEDGRELTTNRSSIYRHDGSVWRMVFNQGTVVPG